MCQLQQAFARSVIHEKDNRFAMKSYKEIFIRQTFFNPTGNSYGSHCTYICGTKITG
jgi:hypothetical protein